MKNFSILELDGQMDGVMHLGRFLCGDLLDKVAGGKPEESGRFLDSSYVTPSGLFGSRIWGHRAGAALWL